MRERAATPSWTDDLRRRGSIAGSGAKRTLPRSGSVQEEDVRRILGVRLGVHSSDSDVEEERVEEAKGTGRDELESRDDSEDEEGESGMPSAGLVLAFRCVLQIMKQDEGLRVYGREERSGDRQVVTR